MPAAAGIVGAVVAQESGVVSVRRTRNVRYVAIVCGMLLAVEDHGGKRRTSSLSLVESGKYLREVLLKAKRGRAVLFSGSARHESAYLLKVERLSGREVVDNDADTSAVTFTENGNGNTSVKQ